MKRHLQDIVSRIDSASVRENVRMVNELCELMKRKGIPSYGEMLAKQWREELAEIEGLRKLSPEGIVAVWPKILDRLEELTNAQYERD